MIASDLIAPPSVGFFIMSVFPSNFCNGDRAYPLVVNPFGGCKLFAFFLTNRVDSMIFICYYSPVANSPPN